MRPLRLTGGLLLKDGALVDAPLSVADGQIVAEGGFEVDLSGYLLLPGIVDLHGDGFERHLAPRRGAAAEPEVGLRALDAELGANGVTTAWLAQFWSWEGGMRAPAFARHMAQALAGYDARADLRMQLRFETHLTDQIEEVAAFVRGAGIDYVVFNDNLPHAALATGKRPARLTGSALRSGRAPEAHLAIMQKAADRGPMVDGALTELVTALPGVRFGSHDDADEKMRARYHALGALIAEFPLTAEAAEDIVVMGAPNVVRGKSQHRNVSARDLIASGRCRVLASDYHYPALMRAAWALHDDGMALAEAWAMISTHPAQVMGLEDRGVLEPGRRADLICVHAQSRAIHGTLAGGRWSWLVDPLATRLMAG